MITIGIISELQFRRNKMGREDEIRLIAYSIWEEEGCLDGRDCEHWVRAEAIWEDNQKPKRVAKSGDIESKLAVKQATKVMATKKKSQKT
jgi:hypothetical protein